MSSDWAETKVILHELEQLFNRDDDIRDILDIKKMQNEISIQSANRLKDAREVIKLMTAQIAAKEAEISAPSQKEHEEALRKVSNKENLSNTIEQLRNTIDSKKQNIAQMSATAVNLKERAAEFTMSSEMTDSRTAYAISLYAKISNITWDYKAPPGKLAGCIGSDEKKEFQNFEVDTRSMDSFEVSNRLWDLIGQQQGCI